MHPQRTLIEAAQQVYEQFGTPGGFGHPDTPLVPKDRGPQRTFSGRGGDGKLYRTRGVTNYTSPFTDPEKIQPRRIPGGPADYARDVFSGKHLERNVGTIKKALENIGLRRSEPYKSKRPTPQQASTTEFLTVFKDQLRGKSPDEIEAGGGLHTHGIPKTPYDDSAYGERPKHWLKPFGEK